MAHEGPYGLELELFVFAELCVTCEKLSIEEITEILQLTPTDHVRKDDVLCEYKSRPFRSPTNLWRFSSEGKVRSNNLYYHTEWMVKELFGKTPAFKLLKNAGAHLKLSFHIYSGEDYAGGFLELKTIKLLAQLGIEFAFNVHYVDFSEPLDEDAEEKVEIQIGQKSTQ